MPLPPLPDPPRLLSRLWGNLKLIVAMSLLFSTLIAFNALQTATLLIKLVSPAAFRRINRDMANMWWGWCDKYAEHIYGTEVVFSGDEAPMRENALVLPNHQEMSDITVLFRLARRKGRLGDMKWFVKDSLKYVPGIGWGMLFLDCLFIKRDWTTDEKYLHKVFEKILANRIPLWLMTFVEGTRIRAAKVETSRNYAQSAGLKPLKHLLTPRTKGFSATVENLRGHLDAVYDVTIAYMDGVPTIWQWTKGYVKLVNVHVRRYVIAELPEGDEALASWLQRRFEEKEHILEHYYRSGAFPETPSAASCKTDK